MAGYTHQLTGKARFAWLQESVYPVWTNIIRSGASVTPWDWAETIDYLMWSEAYGKFPNDPEARIQWLSELDRYKN